MRRLCCLILLTVALGLTLAACGDSTPTTAPAPAATTAGATTNAATTAGATTNAATTNAATTAAPAAATGNKVKVVWWHISTGEPGKSTFKSIADAYMQAHANVSIEINVLENEAFKSKLATAMQSGNPPDLFQSWGGGVLQQYAAAGLVKDLSSSLQGDWGNSFSKAALSVYGDGNGKYFGVPWDMGMVGFWYNKALFQQAGIANPPATWSDLLADVSKLKAAGITPVALGEKDKWTGAFYWVYLATRLGGKDAFTKAYNRSGTFADQPFVQAGTYLNQLVALKPFPNGSLGLTYDDQETLMGNGKAAMELMGQWSPGNQKDHSTNKQGLGDNLGFFPFPAVEGGAGDKTDVVGGGNGIAVGKNAPPEAIDFLRYFTNVENQSKLAQTDTALPPVAQAASAVTNPLLQTVLDTVKQAKYFQLYYDQFLPPATGSEVNDATQGLFAGTSQPADAAKAIEDAAASDLKK